MNKTSDVPKEGQERRSLMDNLTNILKFMDVMSLLAPRKLRLWSSRHLHSFAKPSPSERTENHPSPDWLVADMELAF